ncbi:hypothetical protein CFOL_v3_17728, partial [Cephalotus follicularis]
MMEKPNPSPKSNSTNQKKKDMKKKKKNEFEYCNVCKLNHDQGKQHKYFTNHKKSLTTLLSRFQNKIADIRFFLKNPALLPSEYASRNRLWCVFCDVDIDELQSSFASANAINHLASADHLKNLKHFLWKYGGGMDRVDIFTISEADVYKWEKKCQSLQTEAAPSGEGSLGVLVGPSNDIHTQNKFENMDSFENNTVHLLKSNISNGVPLQYYTNEYQVSYSGHWDVANIGSNLVSSLPAETCSGTISWVNDLTVWPTTFIWMFSFPLKITILNFFSYESVLVNFGYHLLFSDLQKFAEISAMAPEEGKGNVHSGATPPWFEAFEQSQLTVHLKPVSSSFIFPPNKLEKSRKLNPKRVGAAWAERRKMEIEMEKRGEIDKSDCDASWLPNFGRVWQSGSRKESRKEFEIEKHKLLNVESHSEMPVKIQPYISKRM